MKKWTEEKLLEDGYQIENARIKSVDLSIADHGCMTLEMTIEGDGWGVVYGGRVLGKGYLGCDDEFFEGSAAGMESIIRIMDVVGCERFNEMKGEYLRVATEGWGGRVEIIGNIVQDKWFDAKSFFEIKRGENNERNNLQG